MAALAELRARETWYVEVATGRVVRRERPGRETEPTRGEAAPAEEAAIMAENELDPREDLKAAKEFLEHLNPLKAVKEALEMGAELLDPAESDARAVVPEPETVSEFAEDGPKGRAPRPREAHPMPDAKELEKEHRGY